MALASILALCAVVSLAAAAELTTDQHHVSGLTRDAEILVDRWRILHITAQTTLDTFFAQGFSAARDLLWQNDLWRKRGLGELARDFGPAWVEYDRAARLFLFRGDMPAELIAYASMLRAPWTRFVPEVGNWSNTCATNFRGSPTIPAVRITATSSKPGLTTAISLCFSIARRSRPPPPAASSCPEVVFTPAS